MNRLLPILMLLASLSAGRAAILDGATTTFPNPDITRARLGIVGSNSLAGILALSTNYTDSRAVALSNLAYSIGLDGTNLTSATSNALYQWADGVFLYFTNWTGSLSNLAQTKQHGSAALTNASGNPNLATNLLGAGSVTVTSNNLGEWTITGSGGSGDAGGTNARQFGTLTLTNLSGTGAVTNRTAAWPLPMSQARLPATNYPTLATGWPGAELWFARTNFEGGSVPLSCRWQTVLPADYVSNTLAAVVHSTLTATNGPNSSNVIWRVSVAAFPTGATNDFRLWAGGAQVSATNTWAANYLGTNQVQAVSVDLAGNTDGAQAGSLVLVALDRDNTNDTYVGASALVGMEMRYTRQ